MRKLATAVMTLGLMLAMSATALAGNMAITSFESLPDEFQAGTTYTLTYTVLQHGVTPVDGETSLVFTRADDGETAVFEGEPTDEIGRYTVEVTIPSEGNWEWQVIQDVFPPQDMGVITVAPDAGAMFPGTSIPLGAAVALLGIAALLAAWSVIRRANAARPATARATTQAN
jgi:hypothetical protein